MARDQVRPRDRVGAEFLGVGSVTDAIRRRASPGERRAGPCGGAGWAGGGGIGAVGLERSQGSARRGSARGGRQRPAFIDEASAAPRA